MAKNKIQEPDLMGKEVVFEGLLPKAAAKIGEIGTELKVASVDALNEE